MPHESLISNLDRTAPGFADYLESDANLFVPKTPAGIFAACSHFVRDRPMDPERWQALAQLLNDAVAGPDAEVAEAASTCFLENLATMNHPLKPFLIGNALRYWEQWESAAR
jgi:hypothetical protein